MRVSGSLLYVQVKNPSDVSSSGASSSLIVFKKGHVGPLASRGAKYLGAAERFEEGSARRKGVAIAFVRRTAVDRNRSKRLFDIICLIRRPRGGK